MADSIVEITEQLQEHVDSAKALESKVRWHVARDGTGGSHKKADQYSAELELVKSGMRSLNSRLRQAVKDAEREQQARAQSIDLVEEAERLLAPRTELNRPELLEWAKRECPADPAKPLRLLALRTELYGMQDWRGKDFRESVQDWFWEGLRPTRKYTMKKAVSVVLDNAHGMMEEDTSLEDLLKELNWEDKGDEGE